MRKIYAYYYKLNITKVILLGILLMVIFNLLANILCLGWINGTSGGALNRYLASSFFWIATLIIPLIETVLFQYFPIKIFQIIFRPNKYRYYITIILSSIIFASLHTISVLYFLIVLFCGHVLAFSCFVFMRRKQHPIFYTALIHACYNGILVTVGRVLIQNFN